MKDTTGCDPRTCSYHRVTEEVVSNLKEAVKEIVKTQADLRDGVVQLTEAFKGVEKLEERVNKLEERQREKDRLQDKKIEENTKQIYKWMGGLAVIALGVPLLLKFLLT